MFVQYTTALIASSDEDEVELERIQGSKSEFSAIGKLHSDCDGFSIRLTMHSYKFESTFPYSDLVSC
jgi:hypothetical protein